jgi:signal transduction histidine kinase
MTVLGARRARAISVRAHLAVLVIATTVPALVVAAFLVRRVVTDNRAAVERQLLEAARAEAAIVDSELHGTIRALQGLAESDHLPSNNLPAFYAQAQRLLVTQPTWSAISLSTPDGHQIGNTSRPLGEPLPFVTDAASFEQIVRAKKPTIGTLRIGRVSNELGFPVRVPAIHNGQAVYVVSAWITSRSFATILHRDPPAATDVIRGVIDPNGVLVARSQEGERYAGQKATPDFLRRYESQDEAVFRTVALDGKVVYVAYSRAPMSRWIAGVSAPASAVDAPFRRSMIAVGAIAVLLVGFGGGGTYLVSRRISRDLSASAAEAERIAEGLGASTRQSRVSEIQRLFEALARSAALLAVHQHERDEQVARADAARAEAEAADQAKDQFLAMLGHELRNPLAPALTALQLMKMREGDTTREREIIERQIRHMARLVDDLLDVSRLRRGIIELRRETFEVADAVARAVEMTMPAIEARQHRLEIDVPPRLLIDADRIRIAQVLSNLLSNAANYTEPGGHVLLRARREDGFITIECRDTGIGIAADLLPRVFDLFVQGPRGLDRKQGGLGLGLALSRTLVELHGGTIAAKSDGPGQGSTFVVRLPAAAAEATVPAPGPAVHSTTVPRAIGRVLVVDDNPDALDTLLAALRASGLDAVGASSSTEALDLARREHPQVAVLDIGLPEMDGFELARALRASAGEGAIRLIALTGYGRDQDMSAAEMAGFDAFFVKPVDIQALLSAVSQLAA